MVSSSRAAGKTNGRLNKSSRKNATTAAENGTSQISVSDTIAYEPMACIRPSPENDQIYRPIDHSDRDFRAFTDLGTTVEEGGFEAIAGVEHGEILMKY